MRRASLLSLALFVAGGVIGLLNMMLMPVPFGWGYEMVTLATNLANHGTYANPYSVLDTGLTAAYTPENPIFCRSLCARSGTHTSRLGATVANIPSMLFLCLPRVSWLFFRSCDLEERQASNGCSRLTGCQIGTQLQNLD